MRLIDADLFSDKIRENKELLQKGLGKDVEFAFTTADSVLKAVENQPTAYDVDAVVGQLEKEKQTSTSAKNEAIIGMCGASANHYGGAECAYQRAIKIVKRSRKEREIGMTLENFLENYGGNGCISIDGYCEEKEYDHIYDAEWWNELKDKEIASWNIIGGGIYPLELFIEIQE